MVRGKNVERKKEGKENGGRGREDEMRRAGRGKKDNKEKG